MGEYVKEFAKSNGYDEPVVLRTKQDLADAAKTENDKTIIENMSEGAHYPGYYEDGKIHIYLEGSTGSEELRETFEHESVHADNDTDPSRVESLVYSITDMNTLTRRDLESVIEKLVHDTIFLSIFHKVCQCFISQHVQSFVFWKFTSFIFIMSIMHQLFNNEQPYTVKRSGKSI